MEEVRQDEVKDWFKSQMVKAKKFQPLAVLNQKFKGLDVFESNDAPHPPRSPDPRPSAPAAGFRSTISTPEPVYVPPNPDEVVTKAHWQRRGLDDKCSEPTCGKRLVSQNGSVNCRHCGKLFCDEHTMYQMKLSRSAQHEPVRGLWCRVCETCYKSREGYNERSGLERDDTVNFEQFRRKTVDKTLLEVSRLEKRLTKLTHLLANPPLDQTTTASGYLWPLAAKANQKKHLEQSVVDWEDDAGVARCPFCQQEFSNYVFRRHHCRLCGRVVCGDPLTDCSNQIGLTVAAREYSHKPLLLRRLTVSETDQSTEKPKGDVQVDVRMCKDCRTTIFSRSDFAAEAANKSQDVKAYEILIQFERGIRLMLPKFQRLLIVLQWVTILLCQGRN